MRKNKWLTLPVMALLMLSGCGNSNDTSVDSLYTEFQNPPAEARPRVWWHWMDGNVTKDGIYKDLTWMKRSGIAGFMNFYAGMATPQIVSERLTFLSDGWKDAFQYATQLADSLGLEMSIACSPGWSFTGGPWVEGKDGMKKLVWREVRVDGGQTVDITLPEPYKTIGTFQNIPRSGNNNMNGTDDAANDGYYEDIAVLAYRLPETDVDITSLNPTITSSGGSFSLRQLTDGDLAHSVALPPAPNGQQAWIQYNFAEPVSIKAITWVDGITRGQWGAPKQEITRQLEVSQDGQNFTKVCDLPNSSAEQGTVSFPAATGRYFRVKFDNHVVTNAYAALFGMSMSPEPTPLQIAELVLHTTTRVNHAEEKAGFAAPADLALYPTPTDDASAVKADDVIDITANVKDGHLNWNAPEGKWKVVRYGYGQTGKQNSPAPVDATGFEIDKMDPDAVSRYFDYYIGMYKEITGSAWGNVIQYLMADSYESEQENWTPQMMKFFKEKNGYDLQPWMPALSGQIINNSADTERFLRDWRRTLGRLVVENLYNQMTEILNKQGMGRYTESHENGRVYLTDGMEVKAESQIPMSAAWMPNQTGASTPAMSRADVRESASVAHIYGQNIVAGESFTAPGGPGLSYAYHPANIKSTADMEMASGLNRFVIHTSVHQPSDEHVPGLGLGPIGQWFNRHESWAEQAWAWMDYLARSSYMLQQGHYVADVLYYYGEDNNITGLFGEELPDVPAGYSFDFVNSDALLRLVTAQKGKLCTPSGMQYRILVLDDNCQTLPLNVVRKIEELAKAGIIICGTVPQQSGSLTDDEEEFQHVVKEVWGSKRANVLPGGSMEEALKLAEVKPDATLPEGLRFVHRHTDNADIYWVNNPEQEARTVKAQFRVTGRKPELWHPEDGSRQSLTYVINDGYTEVELPLKQDDAVFVVFGGMPTKISYQVPEKQKEQIANISGPWKVEFQAQRGAPAEPIQFESLIDLTQSSVDGIKYFSGTAKYTANISLSAEQINAEKLLIDLGNVADMAEVLVNGQSVGLVWKAPFTVDAKQALHEGDNTIEIDVTNRWINRMVGDGQLPEGQRVTWTPYPFYASDAQLVPSGLIGPVTITAVK